MTTTDVPEGDTQQQGSLVRRHGSPQSEGAGGVAAQQQSLQAALPQAAPGPPPTALRLHRAVVILGTLSQAAVTVSQWAASPFSGQLQTAIILVAVAAVAATALARPNFYWRHRVLLQSVARTGLYVIPSFRQVGVGTALMLERPPNAGWKGAATDLARVVCGTRLLGLAVGGAVIPLPPALTLVTQLTQLLLIANSQGYCGTLLLSHPLTQARARQLSAVIECGALPVLLLLIVMEPASMAVVPHPQLQAGWEAQQLALSTACCCATLLFMQLVMGVLLPTMLAAQNWHPEPGSVAATTAGSAAEPWHADEAEGSSTSATAATPLLQLPPQHYRRSTPVVQPQNCVAAHALWERVSSSALHASAAADRALHVAMQCESAFAARAAIAWFLLALCWAVSKRLAGLPLVL